MSTGSGQTTNSIDISPAKKCCCCCYCSLRTGLIVVAGILMVIGAIFIGDACEQNFYSDTTAVVFSCITASLLFAWSVGIITAVALEGIKLTLCSQYMSVGVLLWALPSAIVRTLGFQRKSVLSTAVNVISILLLLFIAFVMWIILNYEREIRNQRKTEERRERQVYLVEASSMTYDEVSRYSVQRSRENDNLGITIFSTNPKKMSLSINSESQSQLQTNTIVVRPIMHITGKIPKYWESELISNQKISTKRGKISSIEDSEHQ